VTSGAISIRSSDGEFHETARKREKEISGKGIGLSEMILKERERERVKGKVRASKIL